MDPETIDQNYAQLQQQGQQTATLIQALAAKLQAADTAGDAGARGWALDLKEITLAVQQEENQTSILLQSIHAMINNHVQTAAPAPAQYAQPQQQNQPTPVGGGMLQRFLGGGIGRAIVSGAGFGIGSDLINKIF